MSNYNPWNKGLTKETNGLLKEIGFKVSKKKKGKTLEELNHKINCKCCVCCAKRGELKGNTNPMHGKKHSIESKKKMQGKRIGTGNYHKSKCKCPFCVHLKGDNHPSKRLEIRVKVSGKNSWMYGRHLTEKTKIKIGKANKGNTYRRGMKQPQTAGDKNPAKRPEVRVKLSGNNSANWIDGRSYLPYTKCFNRELKSKIKERDNYICLVCGYSEKEHKQDYGFGLPVHHINYNKQDSREINLATTCVSCNSKANSNRDVWQDFFEERMGDIYG